ncbi:hypothetical protein Clacol_010205 [Clathrus columnatus]|uniref:Uncharacterized protein n=1 Tax=Clathrus columnatus TaxID=1419009 RepID=A0AAV5AT41_9AGAM|nr:hypothetical protein Clacol_010205 [Clathrus columnatus]
MSYPFPPGAYKIVNFQNGDINTIIPGEVIPVVADPNAAIFTVSDYKPAPGETFGFEIHHLVNILKGGQPANLRLDNVLESGAVPSDKGIVAIFNNAVPNVTVDIDQDHPINRALRAHINAGRGASLSDLTQKLKILAEHHPDCFWYFNKQD